MKRLASIVLCAATVVACGSDTYTGEDNDATTIVFTVLEPKTQLAPGDEFVAPWGSPVDVRYTVSDDDGLARVALSGTQGSYCERGFSFGGSPIPTRTWEAPDASPDLGDDVQSRVVRQRTFNPSTAQPRGCADNDAELCVRWEEITVTAWPLDGDPVSDSIRLETEDAEGATC